MQSNYGFFKLLQSNNIFDNVVDQLKLPDLLKLQQTCKNARKVLSYRIWANLEIRTSVKPPKISRIDWKASELTTTRKETWMVVTPKNIWHFYRALTRNTLCHNVLNALQNIHLVEGKNYMDIYSRVLDILLRKDMINLRHVNIVLAAEPQFTGILTRFNPWVTKHAYIFHYQIEPRFRRDDILVQSIDSLHIAVKNQKHNKTPRKHLDRILLKLRNYPKNISSLEIASNRDSTYCINAQTLYYTLRQMHGLKRVIFSHVDVIPQGINWTPEHVTEMKIVVSAKKPRNNNKKQEEPIGAPNIKSLSLTMLNRNLSAPSFGGLKWENLSHIQIYGRELPTENSGIDVDLFQANQGRLKTVKYNCMSKGGLRCLFSHSNPLTDLTLQSQSLDVVGRGWSFISTDLCKRLNSKKLPATLENINICGSRIDLRYLSEIIQALILNCTYLSTIYIESDCQLSTDSNLKKFFSDTTFSKYRIPFRKHQYLLDDDSFVDFFNSPKLI